MSTHRDPATDPQPAPVNTGGESVHDLLVAELQARKALGLAKWGVPLVEDNGRDPARDQVEELGDALAYAMQTELRLRRLERENERLKAAMRVIASVRCYRHRTGEDCKASGLSFACWCGPCRARDVLRGDNE